LEGSSLLATQQRAPALSATDKLVKGQAPIN
jgi:hypothetical protein